MSQIASVAWGNIEVFEAAANTQYYFQAGSSSGTGGSLTFTLDVTPSPTAAYYYSPFDPTIFDTVSFYDNSYDPTRLGFQSYSWDFGDGTTASGSSAIHQYVADGDYTVVHGVTTSDSRTASSSQAVSVRTHDVSITKFSTVKAAVSGLTRKITADISNKRYPETVRVDLYKSTSAGEIQVASLIQTIPVTTGKNTTGFTFSYTFTSVDAAAGSVVFRAVASIVGARDALPSDNEKIASPTKVPK